MHPGLVTRAVHGDTISCVTTVPRDGMNDNIQTVYRPTNNWQTVGKYHTWTCPKPVFGNLTRTYRHSRDATQLLLLFATARSVVKSVKVPVVEVV